MPRKLSLTERTEGPSIDTRVHRVMNACRFTSMMSTAVTLTAAGAHLMELPAKMRYEPSLYVRLHRTLYPNFGRAAGPAEAVAVATTAALAWWMRRRRPAVFRTTAAAASCLAAAHGIYWGVVQPVNTRMSRWSLEAVPSDWAKWRNRWEWGHAVRAGLVTAALGALTLSVLNDVPDATANRPLAPAGQPSR